MEGFSEIRGHQDLKELYEALSMNRASLLTPVKYHKVYHAR
jgi:hypothetical protein